MVTCISNSPEETLALGEAWGRCAPCGWIVGLRGDLGAGKTQLAKGIALGLGASERVHSPTFALLNQYVTGRLPLFHLDFYRLETRAQIVRAGLEEYLLRPPGVAVIEWIERWLEPAIGATAEAPPGLAPFRYVRLEVIGDRERRISYEDFSA